MLHNTVDEDLRGALNIISHRGKVVALRVPDYLTDTAAELNLEHLSTVTIVREAPFAELFFIVVRLDVDLITSLALSYHLLGRRNKLLISECRLYQVKVRVVADGE